MKRVVNVGNISIGDGSVSIQSMTNTKTSDIDATVAQIKALEDAGCQLVRCSVPDEESAVALKEIVKAVNVPIIADIHFSHKLALMSADAGVSKIRINPGGVVIAENTEFLQLADSHLRNIGHKIVGDTVGVFAYKSALMRPDRIEISKQGNIKRIVGFINIFEYTFNI